MREETVCEHIFNTFNITEVSEVPWNLISREWMLDVSSTDMCRTIVQEELDMKAKMGS